MKKTCVILAIIISSLSFVAFSGCKNGYTTRVHNYYAMGTQATLTVTDNFKDNARAESFAALEKEVGEILTDVEFAVSTEMESSGIYKFNAASAGDSVEINKICFDVLSTAQSIYNDTEGFYNPAVYYAVDLYGFSARFSLGYADISTKQPYDIIKTVNIAGKEVEQVANGAIGGLPQDKYVQAFCNLSQRFGELKLEEREGKYYAVKPEATASVDGTEYSLKLDLGGVGKGYVVDLVDELMVKYGFEYGNFNFGSSGIAIKKFYNDSRNMYTLGFSNPRYNGVYAEIKLKDKNVSTSGDYEQCFKWDGELYSHIIDPTTGKPIKTGVMSATVLGGSAAENDAFTTALMAMGVEKAVEFINGNLADRQVILTFNLNEEYKFVSNIPDSELLNVNENFSRAGKLENGKIVL